MADIAFVNGKFLPLAEAFVHVEDRGYQFGDGVYEVVLTYEGVPFALEEHMDRFFKSMEAIKISPPYTREEMVDLIHQANEKAQYPNAVIYYHMTRGTSPRSHPFPQGDVPSNFVITVREFETRELTTGDLGVKVSLAEDIRWGRCNIKSLNLLPNILARQEAVEQGGVEAVLHKDGYITEGAAANLFAVINGEVHTHPADNNILAGITRKQVLELCQELGIKAHERAFTVEEFLAADEAFLTSTGIGVLPIGRVDESQLGDGLSGTITKRLQEAFQELIAKTKGNTP